MSTFNVCYLREYIDPECESETFSAYETIYRKICYNCHTSKRAMKKNITRLEEVRKMSVTTAVNNGFQTASQHKEHLAKKAGGYRK